MGLGPFALGLAQVDELELSGRASLWLYCDELDAEVNTLREAGIEVVRGPQDMEWGERMATICDPDGNEIHLGQR